MGFNIEDKALITNNQLINNTVRSKKKIRVGCDQKFQLANLDFHKGVNYV
jgi:hypothetical protein